MQILRHDPLSPEIIRLKTQLGDVEIKIRDNIRSSQFQRESRALNVIKSNLKYFYSYAKRFSKVKSRIGLLKKLTDGNYENDPSKMAAMLQEQFCEVFSDPTSSSKIVPPELEGNVHCPYNRLVHYYQS